MNVMSINLDYLLERDQATEEQIIHYLVAHFYEAVRHLALTMLDDPLAADDVAQETMLKAVNRIEQYKPHTNLKAWIYRIGLNEARAELRRNKARSNGAKGCLSVSSWYTKTPTAYRSAVSL